MFAKSFISLAILSIFISVLTTAAVANPTTPTSEKGIVVVDAAKAKSLMDSGAVMIDARVANEYVEAHVKGAKSIPYKEKSAKATNFDSSVDSFDLSKLPSDRSAAIVFYCNGAECWKSYKAAVLAAKAGYKKVFWLRDGLPAWKASGFPVE
jgi:rhodanese-related sulfurtransferase